MRKVLVLEDEAAIRDFVVLNLKRNGYSVVEAASGEEAVKQAKLNTDIDIAVLDVMLPGLSGIEVAKVLRASTPQIGIIMLTAKTQETDKVTGFMAGADDYVTKPFSPSELLARVDALYRRLSFGKKKEVNALKAGDIELDPVKRTCIKNGEEIELTQIEFALMRVMLENKNVALPRADILKKVWGKEGQSEEKLVDVNMRRLRMKIEDDPSDPKYIITLWGFGYKWVCED